MLEVSVSLFLLPFPLLVSPFIPSPDGGSIVVVGISSSGFVEFSIKSIFKRFSTVPKKMGPTSLSFRYHKNGLVKDKVGMLLPSARLIYSTDEAAVEFFSKFSFKDVLLLSLSTSGDVFVRTENNDGSKGLLRFCCGCDARFSSSFPSFPPFPSLMIVNNDLNFSTATPVI